MPAGRYSVGRCAGQMVEVHPMLHSGTDELAASNIEPPPVSPRRHCRSNQCLDNRLHGTVYACIRTIRPSKHSKNKFKT